MKNGSIVGIYITAVAGAPMQSVDEVVALQGIGLEGDRYAAAAGSFNKGKPGKRQVTLFNARYLPEIALMGLTEAEIRRNLFCRDVELNWLSSEKLEFRIGAEVILKGVKYCPPCGRLANLLGKKIDSEAALLDCGGIIAEVIHGGIIRVGDEVIHPPRGY